MALATDHDRDEKRLGRMTHVDPVEALDLDIVRVRDLRREPGGQPLLDRAHQRFAVKRMRIRS